MINDFSKYIKAVGTGARHNYDLKVEEMEDAMSLILQRKDIYDE